MYGTELHVFGVPSDPPAGPVRADAMTVDRYRINDALTETLNELTHHVGDVLDVLTDRI